MTRSDELEKGAAPFLSYLLKVTERGATVTKPQAPGAHPRLLGSKSNQHNVIS